MIEDCRNCGEVHDMRSPCYKKKEHKVKKAKVKIIEQSPPKIIEYNGYRYELMEQNENIILLEVWK